MGHDPFRQTFMTVKIKKEKKVACLENNFLIMHILRLAPCMGHIEQICGKSQEKSK
jgi:hypothetical protein